MQLGGDFRKSVGTFDAPLGIDIYGSPLEKVGASADSEWSHIDGVGVE